MLHGKVSTYINVFFFFSLVSQWFMFTRDAEVVGDLIVSIITLNSGQIHVSVMIIIMIICCTSFCASPQTLWMSMDKR